MLQPAIFRRVFMPTFVDLSALSDVQRNMGGEWLVAVVEALPPETPLPKPCPKCGAPTPVKVRNRVRSILTVAGELRLSRITITANAERVLPA